MVGILYVRRGGHGRVGADRHFRDMRAITGGCWTSYCATCTCPSWTGASVSNEVRLTPHHFTKVMCLLVPQIVCIQPLLPPASYTISPSGS